MTEVTIDGEKFIAEPVRKPIGGRTLQVLTCISFYIEQHGYPPTLREIAKATDLHSTSAVAHQLRVLEARGYIQRAEFTPRAIKVIP